MARWRFVHRRDNILIIVEADTWEEALAKIGQGDVIYSTSGQTKLPPGFWDVSEEPPDQPTMFLWKFVYRCNEMSATVEANTVEEATAKLLAWETIDLEINPLGFDPEHWDLVEGPIIIITPEMVATLKARFSAPTPEFWEWVKEFTGKPKEVPG